jgi:dihydropteroate synthase
VTSPRGVTRAVHEAEVWKAGSRSILLDRPIVIGLINVTPDSFSDGGNFLRVDDAVAQASKLIEDGADVLDIGGESTRPGAVAIPAEIEIERVIPVIEAIRAATAETPISIDTNKSDVARRALDAGADIINDVSAARLDDSMPALLASSDCGVVLMHSRGGVEDMASYDHASYKTNPSAEIAAELADRARMIEAAGVERARIVLDPGIGFSKRSEESIALLRNLDDFRALGYPILVGPSRKRFVREILGGSLARGGKEVPLTNADRDLGTVGASVIALAAGARLFRVHDVWSHRRALDVAWTVLKG